MMLSKGHANSGLILDRNVIMLKKYITRFARGQHLKMSISKELVRSSVNPSLSCL